MILEALSRKQPISYYPIEISSAALAMCQRELSDINSISIVGFEREYLDGLLEVAARREEEQHLMVLFLGSTIGNFDGTAGVEFLSRLREILTRRRFPPTGYRSSETNRDVGSGLRRPARCNRGV